MRVGRFKIETRTLNSKRIDKKFYLQVMFEKVFIIETRPIKEEKCIEFKGICEEFDDILEGQDIPMYDALIDRKHNKAIFTRIHS